MSVLYFKVPDPDPATDGIHSTTLQVEGTRADTQFAKLCKLLGLSGSPSAVLAYARLTDWQRAHGLISDGVVGPFMWAMLRSELDPSPASVSGWSTRLSADRLARLFPYTQSKNIQIYAPYVLAALDEAGYGPATAHGVIMCRMALATIRAESEGFAPLSELISKYNTPPGGTPFSLYDTRADLGNDTVGDGERFKGRGFVQLTGKANYQHLGVQLGLPLERLPFLANSPDVAAVLLVEFLRTNEAKIVAAIKAGKYANARKLVNGEVHGLDRFTDTLERWDKFVATSLTAAGRRSESQLKRTRRLSSAEGFSLPVKTDPVDLRDLPFRPQVYSLPALYPPEAAVSKLFPLYHKRLVLNQGQEGACTGFGLACVVNYLRFNRCKTDSERKKLESVSPRMLYEFARHYDEYAGYDYEGSSCRGALKGWHKHGVCHEDDWKYTDIVPSNPNWTGRALDNTLGVYYRVDKGNLVDMQAAIYEVGAIYVSAYVHSGWDLQPASKKPARGTAGTRKTASTPGHASLPQITYERGKTPRDGAHSFAVVGYNSLGFVIQNSWGLAWGDNGFALLSYDDWLDNGMDAWAAALGVPGVVNNAAVASFGDGVKAQTAIARGSIAERFGASIPPRDLAARHSVVLDQGVLTRTSTSDVLQPMGLGEVANAWPRQWFESWKTAHPKEPARLVLYAHGGLNSEKEGLRRAKEMVPVFLDNGCYPIFFVWKTGLRETLENIRKAREADPRLELAGNILTDATDWAIEKMFRAFGGKDAWHDMKKSAALANRPSGGLTQIANTLQDLKVLVPDLEVHLIGHSAGSILLGPLVASLFERRVPVFGSHLFAPACSIAFANAHWLPYVGKLDVSAKKFPLYLSMLSDAVEQQDNTAYIYRKSLLYLVARAFEDKLSTPLLGMDSAWDRSVLSRPWNNDEETLQTLALFDRSVSELSGKDQMERFALLTDPTTHTKTDASGAVVPGSTIAAAHGSFDGDAMVILRTLEKIRRSALLSRSIDLSRVP